jgi:hypothetical protein
MNFHPEIRIDHHTHPLVVPAGKSLPCAQVLGAPLHSPLAVQVGDLVAKLIKLGLPAVQRGDAAVSTTPDW